MSPKEQATFPFFLGSIEPDNVDKELIKGSTFLSALELSLVCLDLVAASPLSVRRKGRLKESTTLWTS
uniref:Uncharacterized protein n=1 Tax=Utricularia reniformis TaxID=192314 RepID=A0A1Y0B346_9LAMI|nr:hypothetical protein AEK19_MT1623 [Utricularia reniformis]ART31807.1 hypothetical protein AEK19_MT1623 [Utricularia reniformis]